MSAIKGERSTESTVSDTGMDFFLISGVFILDERHVYKGERSTESTVSDTGVGVFCLI